MTQHGGCFGSGDITILPGTGDNRGLFVVRFQTGLMKRTGEDPVDVLLTPKGLDELGNVMKGMYAALMTQRKRNGNRHENDPVLTEVARTKPAKSSQPSKKMS